MRALERACTQLGVAFQEGCRVLELRQAPDKGELIGVELLDASGEQGTLPCREAVLTCGAWSAALLPQLPVFPVKGQMLSLQGPLQALPRVIFGPGTYLVPREDGLVVVGATSEPEAGFSEGLTPFGQRQLQEGIAALLGGETVPQAGLGVDLEGGAFLGLEGAESPPVPPTLLHLGVVAGERDDVGPLAELVDRSAGNAGHGCQGVSVKGEVGNGNESRIIRRRFRSFCLKNDGKIGPTNFFPNI